MPLAMLVAVSRVGEIKDRVDFSRSELEALVNLAIGSLSASLQRKAVRKAEASVLSQDGDYDDECADEDFGANQQEEGLQLLIAEFLGTAAKVYGDKWLELEAVRRTLIPNLMNMGLAHSERCDRKFALMVLVDILEFVVLPFCDSAGKAQFVESFLEVLKVGLELEEGTDEFTLESATHGALTIALNFRQAFVEEVKTKCMAIIGEDDGGKWMKTSVENAKRALAIVGVKFV